MRQTLTSVDKVAEHTPSAVSNHPVLRAVRRFGRHRLAVVGAIILLAMALAALFAEQISPYPFEEQDLNRYREAPSAAHYLGTDTYGRDILSRLIFGTRISLSVGFISVAIYEVIAIILGSISGYYGGRVDAVIMRAVDVVMTLPQLIVIVFMVAILGPGIFNTMIAIAALGWTGPCRLVRGQILVLREMDYVTGSRSLGASAPRLILFHLLPGVVGPLVVHATFGIANAILTEAALSFLGFGVMPPDPSWGNMMTAAQELVILGEMPWLWVPPGIAIVLAVLSINFVGDGLRDALDPKSVG